MLLWLGIAETGRPHQARSREMQFHGFVRAGSSLFISCHQSEVWGVAHSDEPHAHAQQTDEKRAPSLRRPAAAFALQRLLSKCTPKVIILAEAPSDRAQFEKLGR